MQPEKHRPTTPAEMYGIIMKGGPDSHKAETGLQLLADQGNETAKKYVRLLQSHPREDSPSQ